MIRTLPKDFCLGAATAAYQVEGATNAEGREPCVWDKWLKRPGSTFDGDKASDFYEHYQKDIERCHQYNIKMLSISFAWTRIMQPDGSVNAAGLRFYDNVIDACLQNQVEPFVALYHFDMPLHLYEKGGWLSPVTTREYLQYVKICFQHFGSRVKHWITMKDPVLLSRNQYITGVFPPNRCGDFAKAVQAVHKMLVAHSKAVLCYSSMNFEGEIGIVHRAETIYPVADLAINEQAALLDNAYNNRMVLDAVLKGKYSENTMKLLNSILVQANESFAPAAEELSVLQEASAQLDFLGVNYYSSHFCEAYSGANEVHLNDDGQRGTASCNLTGVSRRLKRDDVPTTDWDWSIFPHGLYDVLMHIKEEYPAKPIYITEIGLGLKETLVNNTVDDDDRIDYLRQHLDAVLDAVEDGVKVRGCFIWSLIDAMSWTSGYDKRYGLFYVDYATQKRYPKKSVKWLRDLARSRIMLTLNGFQFGENQINTEAESG